MICLLLASSCSILLFSHSVNADLITKVSANTTAVVDFNVRQFVQQLLRTSDSVLSTGERISFRSELLETWTGPELIERGFPYYMAGYDEENKPIWVLEFGKWDLRSVIESGPKNTALFNMHVYAGIYRLYKSMLHSTNPDGGPVTGFNILVDFEGLKLRQIASVHTAAHLIGLFQVFNELLVRHLNFALLINMNYIAERLLNVVKPVLGSAAEKMVVFGTVKERWLPAVLRHFPKDQMPEWYGGVKDFSPLQVYG